MNDAASFPAVSCTALFVVDVSAVGAAYDTLTGSDLPIGVANVSVTTPSDPVEETPVTAMGTPLFNTVKSDGSAVVERRVSLNVNVTVNPVVATAVDDKVGGVWSTAELFVTERFVKEVASAPPMS